MHIFLIEEAVLIYAYFFKNILLNFHISTVHEGKNDLDVNLAIENLQQKSFLKLYC